MQLNYKYMIFQKQDDNTYFMDVGKASFQNDCSSTETLWNEKCHSNKNFMSSVKRPK